MASQFETDGLFYFSLVQTKLLQISLVSNRPILVVPLPFPHQQQNQINLCATQQYLDQVVGERAGKLGLVKYHQVLCQGRVLMNSQY